MTSRRTLRRRLSGVGVVVCAVMAAGVATAGASPVAAPASGPVRAWDGTQIHWLEPAPHYGGPAPSAPSKGVAVPPKPPPDQVLSNETTSTTWAYVSQASFIQSAPSTAAPHVGWLTWQTPDGYASLFVLLRAHWDAQGQEWVKLRIPGRPNGRTGWVQRDALGRFHLTHSLLVVNREQMRMYFYSSGHQIWSAPVGVGKPSTPTPAGHFWIDERIPVTNPSSGYYPFAFATTDYSTLTDWPGGGVVGIHGPYFEPQGIPGHISHGCIRLEIVDDSWLVTHLALGTPVHVI